LVGTASAARHRHIARESNIGIMRTGCRCEVNGFPVRIVELGFGPMLIVADMNFPAPVDGSGHLAHADASRIAGVRGNQRRPGPSRAVLGRILKDEQHRACNKIWDSSHWVWGHNSPHKVVRSL